MDGPSWEDVLHAVAVPMVVHDVLGRVVAANAAYAALLGCDVADLGRLDIDQVTRPDDRSSARSVRRRLADGELDWYETDQVVVRCDGIDVEVRTTTVVRRDEVLGTRLVSTLVPLVVGPPEQLGTRPLGDRLLDFAGESVTLLDRDLRIVYTSSPDHRDYGYPASYWKGRDVSELFPAAAWEGFAAVHEQLLSEPGFEIEREVEIRRVDGSIATLFVRIVNRLGDPLLGGIVVVSRDVTDERAAFEELTRGRVTAEAVADAQTRLLATVSHELRNPLHAVRGIAELLVAEELPPRARELAESLERQIAGLTHVTQDLLDAARLDAGEVEIEAAPTDLHRLVTDVVELGRAAARDTPVTVVSEIAPDTPVWVLADGDRLRQILGNLVGNAVKFTPAGLVTLWVRPSNDHDIAFSIVDTGVGIPPEEQAVVLEPFAVGSTAGESRGAGLGLAIVQRLATAMNGSLELSSTVGEGTRFDVELSLPPVAAPGLKRVPQLPDGLRVLVVEDNPVNQQLARSQLERLGAVPVVAGSGEEALNLLLDSSMVSFDVVLMDQMMPGWSGTDTAARIRTEGGSASSIPIVGLSASASAAEVDRFIASGMTDFLPKPASLRDLAEALSRAIAGRAVSPPPAGASVSADPGVDSFDAGALAKLADELDGDGVVVELVGAFLSELDRRVAAILDDDPMEARRAAHTLTSGARLMGATALAAACARVERGEAPSRELELLAANARQQLERWMAAMRSVGSTRPTDRDDELG